MNSVARAGWRHFGRHPAQLGLAILGVTLGVAVVVAMDLGIQSARAGFQASVEVVAGGATHQIRGGPTGVPDSLPALLRRDGGVRSAAPVVEGFVTTSLAPDRPFRILGVDPLSEGPFRPFLGGGLAGQVDGLQLVTVPGAAFIASATAGALGIHQGERIPVRAASGTGELLVVGILEPTDNWAARGLGDLFIVDVSEAQDLLDRPGRLDRVDLIIPEGAPGRELLEVIDALLPPGLWVEPAGTRTREMEGMIRAFDLNLTALSLLGLVFGIFLIYNTMTFSLVQRRRTFGIFRTLGLTRTGVLRSVLSEAALLGLMGSVLGVLLGVILGRGLVRLVTRTINDLYFTVSVEGLLLPPAVLLKGLTLGVAATLLSALLPAWEAASVRPREALSRSEVESRVRRLVPRAGGFGVLLVGLGTALLWGPQGMGGAGSSVEGAFAGLFALVIGMALLTPVTTVWIMQGIRPVLKRVVGVLGAMAARGVVSALSRTAPAMTALVIAVSVTVGIGVMIQSFRQSVVSWLDTTLQADLYISAPVSPGIRLGGSLPAGLGERIRVLPDVVGVTETRTVELSGDLAGARLQAMTLDPLGEDAFEFLSSQGPDVFTAFRAGSGVLVSEPMAFRQQVSPGGEIVLPGEHGLLVLPVLAVFRDYASDRGTILLDRSVYNAHWTDPEVSALAVYLSPEGRPDEVEAMVREAGDVDAPLAIRANQELRALTLEVFDRTFLITRVLRSVAFIVAFIAVLSALMALQLERSHEFGVLRATGMTPTQSWLLISGQTSLMGVVAGLLAVPVGLVLAAAMIFVVNQRAFGWTMDMVVGWNLPLQSVVLAGAGAILAGLYPSWKLARTSPAEALRQE